MAFLGDYDLTRFGPWYGDRDGSIDETIASVRRLQQLPAKVWLTSHEDGCFEGDVAETFDRYLAVIDEREAKLLDFLAAPRTLADIVAAAWSTASRANRAPSSNGAKAPSWASTWSAC